MAAGRDTHPEALALTRERRRYARRLLVLGWASMVWGAAGILAGGALWWLVPLAVGLWADLAAWRILEHLDDVDAHNTAILNRRDAA
jgi:fatty acid desaturase